MFKKSSLDSILMLSTSIIMSIQEQFENIFSDFQQMHKVASAHYLSYDRLRMTSVKRWNDLIFLLRLITFLKVSMREFKGLQIRMHLTSELNIVHEFNLEKRTSKMRSLTLYANSILVQLKYFKTTIESVERFVNEGWDFPGHHPNIQDDLNYLSKLIYEVSAKMEDFLENKHFFPCLV